VASKLLYRLCLCIEGIPDHAAHIEVINKLLPPTAIVDEIDTEKKSEDEIACVCVWIFIDDPDSIAVEGTLKLEEPVESTEVQHNEFFTRLGNMELPKVPSGPAAMIDYVVILHVDQVVDFTPPPSPLSSESFHNDTCGPQLYNFGGGMAGQAPFLLATWGP